MQGRPSSSRDAHAPRPRCCVVSLDDRERRDGHAGDKAAAMPPSRIRECGARRALVAALATSPGVVIGRNCTASMTAVRIRSRAITLRKRVPGGRLGEQVHDSTDSGPFHTQAPQHLGVLVEDVVRDEPHERLLFDPVSQKAGALVVAGEARPKRRDSGNQHRRVDHAARRPTTTPSRQPRSPTERGDDDAHGRDLRSRRLTSVGVLEPRPAGCGETLASTRDGAVRAAGPWPRRPVAGVPRSAGAASEPAR